MLSLLGRFLYYFDIKSRGWLSYNSWLMSLFIGNVSKKVTHQEFEDAFKSFGNCKIDLRVRPHPCRNDTPSCSSRVSAVQSRLGRHSRIPTSADSDSTLSGPRTQAGSTKTRNPRMIVGVGVAATLASEVGGRKTACSVVLLLSRSGTRPLTPITRTTFKPLYQSPPETQSRCLMI